VVALVRRAVEEASMEEFRVPMLNLAPRETAPRGPGRDTEKVSGAHRRADKRGADCADQSGDEA
jgi:hypothetical protein